MCIRDRDEAKAQFDKYNIPYSPIPLRPLIERHFKYIFKYMRHFHRRCLDYPLVGGYADILVLTSDMMDKFTLYCGAFAATSSVSYTHLIITTNSQPIVFSKN